MRTSPHNLLQLPLVQPVERRKKAQEKEEENEEEALGRMEKKEGHRQLIPKVSLLQKIAECFFEKKEEVIRVIVPYAAWVSNQFIVAMQEKIRPNVDNESGENVQRLFLLF